MKRNLSLKLAVAASPFLLFALTAHSATADKKMAAETEIKNASGAKVGAATFTELEDGVNIRVSVTGLTPGKHGIHIHEKGVCDDAGFKKSGSHLSKPHQKHGEKNDHPHGGDMPNLVVLNDGTGTLEITQKHMTLGKDTKDKVSLLKAGGSALVIHEKEDDQKSDPAGDSGDRIACGVIKAAAKM
ncbi:MAG: superoxide dismutase family protein [Proteobacteria bacterium]|nr:MAG: superoxide dismutase family protein [Pseudomonadota bacterium]